MMLPPGTRLGDYEVQSLIWIGGMGNLYRVRSPDDDQPEYFTARSFSCRRYFGTSVFGSPSDSYSSPM